MCGMKWLHVQMQCMGVLALFIRYVSSIVSPGMSVSFPVTLVPARLALSWSPGPAHVEEQNTRSATVIVHEVLFAPRTLHV